MAEIKGEEKVRRALEMLAKRIPDEIGRALYQEALIEQKESMRRTPIEFGALRSSHRTTLPKVRGRDVSVMIEVGGPAAPYALEVHENLNADHPVGQAKFLESTLNESKPFLAARIARRIDLNRMAR